MKIATALARLQHRYPEMAALFDKMTLAHVEMEITKLRADLSALQCLAHQKRAVERWDKTRPAEARAEAVTAAGLRLLPLAVLRKRASMGGTAEVRALINAEIFRRVNEGVTPFETGPEDKL